MALNANLPVQSIVDLAATVRSESTRIMGELAALRAACQRDPAFVGNAANQYDEYMHLWDSNQKALTDNLTDAGALLQRFADGIDTADQGFNIS